jgi:hypothetical protein
MSMFALKYFIFNYRYITSILTIMFDFTANALAEKGSDVVGVWSETLFRLHFDGRVAAKLECN